MEKIELNSSEAEDLLESPKQGLETENELTTSKEFVSKKFTKNNPPELENSKCIKIPCSEENDDNILANKSEILLESVNESLVGNKKIIKSPTSKKRKGWQRYIGIMFAFAASIVFALATLVVKLLTEYHTYNVAMWRFQGILVPSIFILLYCRFVAKQDVFQAVKPIRSPQKLKVLGLIAFRCLSGSSAVVLQFYSLQFIGIADSTVIAFSTPVFVTFVAYFLLGEKCGIVPVLCAILTLCGVAVIARPPMLTGQSEFDKNTLIGVLLAFTSMLGTTFVFVLLRRLRQVHYSFITSLFGLWGTVECVVLSGIVQTFDLPTSPHDWFLAVSLALLSFIGHGCITMACKFEQAGIVSLIRTCDAIFAFVWQFVFLAILPDIYSLLGAGIVITGVLISGLRKIVGELPPEHTARTKFSFLLA